MSVFSAWCRAIYVPTETEPDKQGGEPTTNQRQHRDFEEMRLTEASRTNRTKYHLAYFCILICTSIAHCFCFQHSRVWVSCRNRVNYVSCLAQVLGLLSHCISVRSLCPAVQDADPDCKQGCPGSCCSSNSGRRTVSKAAQKSSGCRSIAIKLKQQQYFHFESKK